MNPFVITDLDDPRFNAFFTDFQYSAWRLETLQEYNVPYEAEGFAYYRQNGRIAPGSGDEPSSWITDVITPAAEEGRYIGRVHVVENLDPGAEKPVFTDYINFEFEAYKVNKAAGDDIRLIVTPQGVPVDDVYIPSAPRDFWLFDSSVLMEMNYTKNGEFQNAVVHTALTYPTAIVTANKIRDAAMHQSHPFYP